MNVFLYGYFLGNLGDDLFVRILAKRYPKTDFYLIAEKNYCTSFEKNSNIHVKQRNILVKVVDKITRFLGRKNFYRNIIEKKCDYSVLIGGSIFQQMYPTREIVRKSFDLRIGSVNPTFILGANFGPYESDFFIEETANYLRNKEDCCFRDSYSKKMFENIENVRFACDIVFGIKKIFPTSKTKENRCVISLIDFSRKKNLNKYKEAYMSFVKRFIFLCISQKMKVSLLSFCQFEGDENCSCMLMNSLTEEERKSVSSLFYKGDNASDILSLISSSSLMLATRFHAMILGFVYGVPTIPVVYDQKCRHVLEDLGVSDYGVSLKELDSANMNNLKPIVLNDVEKLAKLSEKHFEKLDKILG